MRFIIIPFNDLLESTDSGADCWATTVPKLILAMRQTAKSFKPRRDWPFNSAHAEPVGDRLSVGVHELV